MRESINDTGRLLTLQLKTFTTQALPRARAPIQAVRQSFSCAPDTARRTFDLDFIRKYLNQVSTAMAI
jgi:hypothetical protein